MFADLKLEQSKILLNELNQVVHSRGLAGAPIIIGGDFNSKPKSDVYNYFLNGSSGIQFKDVYSILDDPPTIFTKDFVAYVFTEMSSNQVRCIDYIWYTS